MNGGRPRDDEAEPVSIEGPPPLARMAAVMALVDLVWNRIVVRVLGSVDEETGVALQRAGVFPRNLAAVAAIVALAIGLFGFLRMAGYAGLGRRLGVSSVAGLLMPAFVLAIVMPAERVPVLVVVTALAASNLLAVLLGTVAIQYRAGARRWASIAATTAGTLVLTGLVAGTVQSIAESALGGPLRYAAYRGGELAWHLVLVFALASLFRAQPGAPASEGPPISRERLALVGLFVLGVAGLALYGESHLHAHRFGTLVYGALRLTMVPEPIAWLNGITVGVGLAAALVGLASRSPARAQIGAAAALWLAAGCAPRASGQLLYFALATLLLARAAQAATPEGRARARIPWAPAAAEPDAG